MKFLRTTDWNEVFEGWREREAGNPGWVECATKVKGWPDWEAWRRFTASQIAAATREWKVFQFEDPLAEVPQILMGPFKGWQSRVKDKNSATFAELLQIPEELEFWSGHSTIKSMIAEMPFATQMIGIVRQDINRIVLIDGHHRATAITLAAIQGKNLDFSEESVTIALAELAPNECEVLDQMLERGTSKNL